MAVIATVAQKFKYTAIGKKPQIVERVLARLEFPLAFELDEEIMTQTEGFYKEQAKVEDYDHDGMQTVIKYVLGITISITYEIV